MISKIEFAKKLVRYSFYSALVILFSLGIGIIGYMIFADLPIVDAFLNASMILTGMGPVDRMVTNEGKIFAGLYALYSGLVFLSTTALIFTPILHRIMHYIHLDLKD